jgi:voltage-gated potassium channel
MIPYPQMMTKKRLYEILEVAAADDATSRRFDIFILLLISINVIALVLETVQPLYVRWGSAFDCFETVSVAIFTLEYLLRVWSCSASSKYAGWRGRLRFARTPMAIVDLLAILPFYLPLLGVDLRFVRALRLFRILRIAKLARYSGALRTFADVIRSKRAELITMLTLLTILLLFASSLIYFAEHRAQPKAFASIPAAMWWSIVTLTTVGYGDVYPVTAAGKALAAVIAVLGIGLFALPTGLLGAAFIERLDKTKRSCPECGADVH